MKSLAIQIPAEGIMKTNDWGDSKVYRIACECSDESHNHNMWIESEDTGVVVSIYTTSKTNWYSKTRWNHIWTLITKGYIDTESVVHMKRQQAFNYAHTLLSAVEDVEQFRKKQNENGTATNQ
jgi:hypothetical protein